MAIRFVNTPCYGINVQIAEVLLHIFMKKKLAVVVLCSRHACRMQNVD